MSDYPSFRRVKIPVKGATLNVDLYEVREPGTFIIFLPGTGCSASLYHPFLQALSWEGYNIAGMDYRGHGLSSGERGDWTVEEVIEDVEVVMRNLSSGLRCGVMGSSQGGFLALYTLHELDGLSFGICHNGGYLSEIIGRIPPLKIFVSILRRFPHMKLPHLHVNWRYVFEDRKKLKPFLKNPLFVPAYSGRALHSLFTYSVKKPNSKPVLLLTGEKERVVPNVISKMAKKKLKELCTYVEIKGAGHMLLLEWMDEVIKEIKRWIQEVNL